MNRKRLKGDSGTEDCCNALNTLYEILLTMVKMMAPFTPYLSEFMYQRLRLLDESTQPGSVHYEMMPKSNEAKIHLPIERAVSRMQAIVELGRIMRDRRTVPIKYPLTEVVVIHQSNEYLEDVKSLQDFIAQELNVRSIVLSSDKAKYGIVLRAEPDHKLLGLRLKNDFKNVLKLVKELQDKEIQESLNRGHFVVGGHKIELNEIHVIYQFGGTTEGATAADFEAHSDNDVLVLLNMKPNQELVDEGTAREVINRIQKLKKKAKLIPTDPVIVFYDVSKNDSDIGRVVKSHQKFIENVIKSAFFEFNADAEKKELLIEETQDLKEVQLKLKICSLKERVLPKTPYINIVLAKDINGRFGNDSKTATLNLIDTKKNLMTLDRLRQEICVIFGIYQIDFYIVNSDNKPVEKLSLQDNGKSLFVVRKLDASLESAVDQQFLKQSQPFSKFKNTDNFTLFLENPANCKISEARLATLEKK